MLIGGTDGPSSTFADNFNGTASYTDNNGTATFTGGWTETGDVTTGNIVTGGQIRISGGGLVFGDNDNDPGTRGCADPAFAQPERGERGHSQLLVR